MADTNPNDAVFKAIDQIVQQRISNLEYDKTVICKITDDTDAINGHYIVNDGAISFDAYSENDQYKADESVYVTIPKGDYTQKKVIISKYVANNDENPLTWKSPLDQMFVITENLTSLQAIKTDKTGILANGRTEGDNAPGHWRLIWEYELNNSENTSIRNNALFDSLGIKAKFKCALGTSYNMKSGHYGIIIELFSNSSTDSNTVGDQSTRIVFDTSEMFGNPYFFLTFFEQAKVIDISKLGNISKINIYLFQSGDFYYITEDAYQDQDTGLMTNQYLVPSTHIEMGKTVDDANNIFIDGLEIYFGMNLANVEDNTFNIYSASPSTFSYNEDKLNENPNYNIKDIIPIWFNKSKDNEYIGFSDGIYQAYDFEDVDGDTSNQPIGKEYDERKYLEKFEYLNRGAKLNQTDLTDKNVPALQELLQIYSYGKQIKSYFEQMIPYVNTKLTRAITNVCTDLRQYQTIEQINQCNTLRSQFFDNVNYNNLINKLNNLTKEDSQNINQIWIEGIVMPILVDFGQAYTNGNHNVSSICSSGFNQIYSVYTDLKNLIINLGDAALNEEQGFFNKVKEKCPNDVLAIWTQWQESCQKIFKDLFNILDKIVLLITPCNKNSLNITWLNNLQGQIPSQTSLFPNANNTSYMDTINWQLAKLNARFSQMGEAGLKDYEETRANVIKSYEKRYCIYWYRYVAGYKNEDEKFLPANWELIEDKVNFGLPAGGEYLKGDWDPELNEYKETSDRNLYWQKRPTGDDATISISVGSASLVQERICAVLIYDHQVYKSNILTYTNEEPVVDEQTADSTKGLYIAITDKEYSTTEYDENGDPIVIQEDTYNNKETYQLYGITGYLVNQTEKYKKRKLRARFNGVNEKTGDNYLAKGCVIYWYIPLNATMLFVNREDLIAAGFSVYNPEYTRGEDEINTEITGLKIDENKTLNQLKSEFNSTYKNNNIFGNYYQVLYERLKVAIMNSSFLSNEEKEIQIATLNNLYKTKKYSGSPPTLESLDSNYQVSNNFTKKDWQNIVLSCMVEQKRSQLINAKYPLPTAPYGNNYQQGYIMAWKNIEAAQTNNGNKIEDEVDIASTEFFYQIKDYYIPSFTNNTIKCRVVKDGQFIYDAECSFTFASFGTNGTDYSLCIVPANNQAALLDNKNLDLKVAVYDVNGDLMEEETNNIEVSWEHNFGGAIFGGSAPDITVSRLNTNTAFGYNVLKAEVTITIESYSESTRDEISTEGLGDNTNPENYEGNSEYNSENDNNEGNNAAEKKTRDVKLTAYYPIPWAAADYYLEGPTIVVYDSLGSNPSYYNGQYRLFNGVTSQDAHKEINFSVNKSCMVDPPYASGQNTRVTTLVRESLPKLKRTTAETGQQKLELSVPGMYLENDFFTMVCIKDNSGNDLFRQPIYMMQNRFSSPMLNAWDGELTIDEKNGTILASMVGAGKKESDNSFSGVLMGDVAAKTEDTAAGAGIQGVYGFNHGEQSFAFKNDGTAFIGKAGKGRIEFDGNHGEIASSSYKHSKLGMLIDLDDGYIDMRGGYVDEDQSENWVGNVNEDSDNSEGRGNAQNNNEINGYDNTTRYQPTGSRVQISTTTPFLKIQSPDILYHNKAWSSLLPEGFQNASTKEAALKSFWNSIDYYQDLQSIIAYLRDSWNLYDAKDYRLANTQIKKISSISGTTQIYSPLEFFTSAIIGKKAPFYVVVKQNLTKSDLYDNSIKSMFTIDWSTLNTYDNTADKNVGALHETPCVKNGDWFYVYFPKETGRVKITNSNKLNLKIDLITSAEGASIYHISALPTDENPYIVNKHGVKTPSPIGRASKVTINVDNDDSILSVQSLASHILNNISYIRGLTTTPTSNDLVDNISIVNLKRSYAVNFLTKSDYDLVIQLYNALHDQDTNKKESKTLMEVGTESYYLMTDNYIKGTSDQEYMNGKGLKFDLMHGNLEAYNFKLFAASDEGNFISLNTNGAPFFQISYFGDNRNQYLKDNNQRLDLIKISNNDFIMQSQNWFNGNGDYSQGSGTQFDLKNGKLISYSFDLKAYDNDGSGSYVQLSSSGAPYFEVKRKWISDEGTENELEHNVSLIYVGRNKLLLQSSDWDPANHTGTQYNVEAGKITSYNFSLLAYNNGLNANGTQSAYYRYRDSYIKIQSNGDPYLRVHHVDDSFSEEIPINGGGTYTYQYQDPKEVDLIYISNNTYRLRSFNFESNLQIPITKSDGTTTTASIGRGIDWNLKTGAFTMYSGNITLKGYSMTGVSQKDDSHQTNSGLNGNTYQITDVDTLGFLKLNSDDNDTPFNVNNKFKIFWDGSFLAETGKIGGWRVNNTSIWANGTYGPEDEAQNSQHKAGTPNNTTSFLMQGSGTFKRTLKEDDGTTHAPSNDTNNIYYQLNFLKIAIGQKFAVSSNGTLYANDGHFAGYITAKSGKIGAWDITEDGTLQAGRCKLQANGYISGAHIEAWYIDCSELYASGTGTIGGWTIGASTLTGGGITLDANGSISGPGGTFTLDSTGISTSGMIKCTGLTISGKEYTPHTLDATVLKYGSGSFTLYGSQNTFSVGTTDGSIYVGNLGHSHTVNIPNVGSVETSTAYPGTTVYYTKPTGNITIGGTNSQMYRLKLTGDFLASEISATDVNG